MILISAIFITLLAQDASKSVIEIKLLTMKLIIVSFIYITFWFIFRTRKKVLCVVLGGVTCFGEVLHPVQWLGVGVIIIGVLLITIKKEKELSQTV